MSSEPLTLCNEKGPLPLVLAVSGHNDLRKEDHEPLKDQVRAIFKELAESYPFTPLQLVCGLAEGADSLAASVALECGISMVVCLPMEKSLYECDFKTPESRREFEALLGRAARIVTLPLAADSPAEKVKTQGPGRDLQYHALAEYLVAQSQILIALWDGVDTGLMGGTSSVVHMQLGRQPDGGDIDPDHPIDYPETGPVFQIVTPRIKNPRPSAEPYKRCAFYHRNPSGKGPEEFYARIFSRMDAFNRDAVKNAGRLEKSREQSRKTLLPDDIRREPGDPMSAMVGYHSLADALAIYYENLTRKSFRTLIFGSGLAAVFLFECFAHGPDAIQIPALLLYVLLIGVTYAIYQMVKPGQFKTKYLDYRALAEGLRLQIFWRFAGLKEEVADYYLRKQKTELDWIRNAIRAWSTETSEMPRKPDFNVVQIYWIEAQSKFFDKVSARDHRRRENEERWTFRIIVLAMGIALLTLLSAYFAGEKFHHALEARLWPGDFGLELRGLIVIVMAILPAVAGAIAGYSLKMAVSEQEKQYHRMKNLFNRGLECLKQALQNKNDPLAVRTILDLGKEALEENGDWVMLHRDRSVEMPLG